MRSGTRDAAAALSIFLSVYLTRNRESASAHGAPSAPRALAGLPPIATGSGACDGCPATRGATGCRAGLAPGFYLGTQERSGCDWVAVWATLTAEP